MPRDTSRLDMSVDFQSVNIAVLTISDTRTPDDDRSGDLLAERIVEDGHVLFQFMSSKALTHARR